MSYSKELLTEHKQELERDLKKSLEAFNNELISEKVHSTHVNNLTPKISDLETNIKKL